MYVYIYIHIYIYIYMYIHILHNIEMLVGKKEIRSETAVCRVPS